MPPIGKENYISLCYRGQEYLDAVKALVAGRPVSRLITFTAPIGQLLGHCLELALKGCISISTVAGQSRVPRGHDLVSLYESLTLARDSAVLEFLILSEQERFGFEKLNRLYFGKNEDGKAQYLVRYPQQGLFSYLENDELEVVVSFSQRWLTGLDKIARQSDFQDSNIRSRLGIT